MVQGPVAEAAIAVLDHSGDGGFQGSCCWRRQGRWQAAPQAQAELLAVALHAEGKLGVGRLRGQPLAVTLQAVDVPVASRGKVEFPVGPSSPVGQEHF